MLRAVPRERTAASDTGPDLLRLERQTASPSEWTKSR